MDVTKSFTWYFNEIEGQEELEITIYYEYGRISIETFFRGFSDSEVNYSIELDQLYETLVDDIEVESDSADSIYDEVMKDIDELEETLIFIPSSGEEADETTGNK